MSNNRQCMCCDNKYYYCPSCGKDRLKPTWYATFCSETCKELWHTSSRYSMGFITKEEAANIINALEIKDATVYRKRVQNAIAEITYIEDTIKPKKSRKYQKKIEEAAITESVMCAEIEVKQEPEQPTEVAEPVVQPEHEVVIEKEKE